MFANSIKRVVASLYSHLHLHWKSANPLNSPLHFPHLLRIASLKGGGKLHFHALLLENLFCYPQDCGTAFAFQEEDMMIR